MNSLNDIWQVILKYLSAHGVSDTAIRTWFDDSEPVEMDDCRFVIHTVNSFKRNVINERFEQMIKDSLKELFAADFDIEILAGDEIKDYIKAELKKQFSDADEKEINETVDEFTDKLAEQNYII